MLWLYIPLLVISVFLAVVWLRYGLKEHDSLVLGAGVLQVGLGILWTILIILWV
ncbi:MAG: hypothetical protein HWN66_03365 [Candidatus Helarchaeota archaeon]|nr:hypothetical protein [Candidatus Helarchaeota archaeon]